MASLLNMSGGSLLNKGLPYDAEIEYLESDGTQYIDTGIKMRNYLSFDASFIPTGNSTNTQFCCVYGAYRTNDANNYAISCIVPCDNPLRVLGNRYMNISKEAPLHSDRYDSYKNRNVIYHQSNDSFTVKVDDITYDYGAYNSNQIGESDRTIWLFGINYSASYRVGKAKVMNFKISDNGMPILDFIPVRVGTTGYMYAKVSGQLFGNAGTGSFILGPDK